MTDIPAIPLIFVRIAPLLGFSGYQPLIRAYVGQGLRADLERLEETLEVNNLIESLRKQGVEESVLTSAIADARSRYLSSDEEGD